MRPFFCEQLAHTLRLHTAHVPLWPEQAALLHSSHFMLCCAQKIESQM
jgi:hypothetical protein